MKNIFLLFISLTVLTTAYSQTKSPEERANEQSQKMKLELSLTPEQVNQIYEVNYGIIQKNDAMKNSSYTEDFKKQALEQNNQARNSMFKSILTENQYAIFEKKLIEHNIIKKH